MPENCHKSRGRNVCRIGTKPGCEDSYYIACKTGINKERMKSKSGPLIIIEDDLDDQEIIKEILKSLDISNTLLFFSDGTEALTYMQTMTEQPFLILCDVNLPKMN